LPEGLIELFYLD